MYRTHYTRSCPCNQNNEQVLEDICDDVISLSDYDTNECECGFNEEDNLFPKNPMYGNSYVPDQRLNTTFMPDVGLKLGTIFPELVRPYMPGQSMTQIEYLSKTNDIREGCNK